MTIDCSSAHDDQKSLAITLARFPRPSVPAERDWEISLGDLVPETRRVPVFLLSITRSLLRKFSHFGLGPDHLMLNGHRFAWSKIIEVRVRDTVDVVTASISDLLVDQISRLLPWFLPRRDKLTRILVGRLLGVATHVADLAASRSAFVPPLLPYEIVYNAGFGRRERHSVSFFGILILCVVRDVNASFMATAARHRVSALVEQRSTELCPPEQLSAAVRSRVNALKAKMTTRGMLHSSTTAADTTSGPPHQTSP